MDMIKYIIKRILLLIPVILGITLFIYFIMSLAPGDPARMILGEGATLADIEAKRIELGLNDPIIVRYVKYMWDVIRGDFGVSWYNGYNVMEEFASRIPNTLTLGLMANLFVVLVGIPLGVIAAVKQYGVIDYVTLILAMFLSSMPAFWFGLMAQIVFCLNLGWLPATGADTWKHFILPSLTLACASFAGQVRLTRTSILEVNKLDYVRTARAKGCSEGRVVCTHVLRNALLPVITAIGSYVATIVGGAIVTESVFAIPGVASLMINAVKIRDVPVVMGIIIIISMTVGITNLVVDLVYALVDPRVKLQG